MSVTVPSSTWGRRALLGLVEAMDLVDEQDRPGAVEGQLVLGPGDRGANFGHTAHHRRQRRELGADRFREESGEGRLAAARRAPEEERGEMAAGNGTAKGSTLADEVLLPDELVQRARPHPGRERLAPGWRLEQGLRSCAGHASGWHAASLGRPISASATGTA